MKIRFGNKLLGQDEVFLDTNRVSFIAEDGRELFEVVILDKTAIEVRGVNVCKVDGKLYQETLQVQPRASNVIWINAKEYQP